MPLTTGSSSIFPSTSIPLWSFLAVFRPLLKGEILLQCWQSHGGPNPTPPIHIWNRTIWKHLHIPIASCYFDAEKDTVNAFPLMLWWASSTIRSPHFFVTTLPGHSPFSGSHEGFYGHTNDSGKISSWRSDRWKDRTSISAPSALQPPNPKKSLPTVSNQQEDGIKDSSDSNYSDLFLFKW